MPRERVTKPPKKIKKSSFFFFFFIATEFRKGQAMDNLHTGEYFFIRTEVVQIDGIFCVHASDRAQELITSAAGAFSCFLSMAVPSFENSGMPDATFLLSFLRHTSF